MLIDSRSNQTNDFREAIAVTALGRAKELIDAEREKHLALYLGKHPYLEDFVNSPSCALLKIEVEHYYVVSRFQNVMEIHVER
jgi:hypothetical protein